MSAVETYVGQPLPRVEDLRLLIGAGAYAADIDREGQLHARIVRSDVPFGRLKGINAEAALARDGVISVITAADIPERRIPIRIMPAPAGEAALQTALATDMVRYVGDPVAVVVAEDPYLAEDAADQVELDIEPLEPVVDPFDALADDAPILHPNLGTNVVGREAIKDGEDVDELLDEAAVVVRERFRIQRQGSCAMEPRALIAEFEPESGRVSIWGAAKVKHFNRRILAGLLGMEVDSVRLIEGDVGGGFGARGELYPEDFLIPWLAIELERPVKWVEDRHENLKALNQSREQDWTVEAGADAEGNLLGFRARGWFNSGGYVRTHGGQLMPRLTINHMPGPYRWRGFDLEGGSVLTNKTPGGTYRGPGQAEPAFIRERMLDLLARKVGIDPIEFRRRNLITAEEMPYRAGVIDIESEEEVLYEESTNPLVFERLLEHVDYEELRSAIDSRKERGEQVGIGVAVFMEMDNTGSFEKARIELEPDGTFTAHVGVGSVGQGVRTVLTQVAADVLRVPIERIEVSHHDTAVIPEGQGAFSNRATVWGGQAVAGAARELVASARRAAAERFGVAEEEVEVSDGSVRWREGPDEREVALSELGKLEGAYRFERPLGSHLHMGANLAVVKLDAQTGGLVIERYSMTYEAGKVVNPLTANGQVVGAITIGICGALFEEFAYGPDGQPLSTSFMDYAMPTAAEIPPIDVVFLESAEPSPDDPLAGALGMGGGGTHGPSGAIANAVADALGERGSELTSTPIKPELVQRLGAPARAP